METVGALCEQPDTDEKFARSTYNQAICDVTIYKYCKYWANKKLAYIGYVMLQYGHSSKNN